MTITVPDFATPVDPDRAWMAGAHGPTCIPCRRQEWSVDTRTYTYIDVWPHSPGDYGRYFPIDLDANNRHSVDAYCARHPERPRPVFGWGVCRHGFGLQHHDGVLSETEADSWAVALNRTITIGEE